MFIASLIADIIRGMIYLHESPLKYHGSLCTSNCLIDSRWVVKLSDFGLQAFKKGAEDPPNLQTMAAKCQSKWDKKKSFAFNSWALIANHINQNYVTSRKMNRDLLSEGQECIILKQTLTFEFILIVNRLYSCTRIQWHLFEYFKRNSINSQYLLN